MTKFKSFGALAAAGLGAALLASGLSREAGAHCDTMDGPVVAAAKLALDKGDATPVLKWVAKDREDEVKAAFAKTLTARKASAEARDVADTWFFESLVRIHRMGEGEPYTGLKPAGTPLEAGISDADAAISKGSVDDLAADLAAAVASGVKTRFARVLDAKKKADTSVEAGREYVARYVEFMHYVERVHATAAGPAEPHCGHGEKR
jgi:hypothetical protein